jgi:hypothetical protein
MLAHDLISRVFPRIDVNLGAELMGQSATAMMSACMRDKEPQSRSSHTRATCKISGTD